MLNNFNQKNLRENYWQKQLAGITPLLELPTDRPRPPVISYAGKKQYLELPKSLTKDLKKLSQREESTLFMMLLAAFEILLYRYSGQPDIVVGSPIAGRNLEETNSIIGYFVNTLVLRSDLSGNPSFRELLGKVRLMVLDAYEHQELPFDKLVESLNPERSQSYHPLFQVMFVLQTAMKESGELIDVNSTQIPTNSTISKFDLTLELEETSTGINGFFEYRTDLFDDNTISRMIEHFQTLLAGIVANPQAPIGNLPLLTAQEQHQLLVEWNNTLVDYPQDKCIHQLIEQQVKANPDAVAVVFEGQQLTYRELNSKANQLAHYLQSLGVKPESLVGISVDRSLEMVIGLLGILKAGAAYVPLDPTYPADRVAYILSNSAAKFLVTSSNLIGSLPQEETEFICLDREWEVISQQNESNPNHEVKPNNLSYVIYTSGSTGQPKGVQICHRSLVNFINSMQNEPGLNTGDRLLAVTTISFDIHTLEIYLPLTVGATIILASREMVIDGNLLAKEIAQYDVNVMQATPATWRMLLTSDWQGSPNLKVISGGEALPRELVNHLLEKVGSLWNVYGPTETTVWSTTYQVTSDRHSRNEDAPESIGRPIANTQTYILDQCFQPVPIGVIGELYIGGDGVARGYLNRPELTDERFLSNPFEPNSRIYRTGDLVRYLPTGDIEYLGRIDNQVKIRGFRIEMGEIENVLDKHPQVEQGVVIVREDTPGNKQLVAYIVPGECQPTIQEIRQFLKIQLPDYMIPEAFVVLETMPLTPNGKVDRRALPKPEEINQEIPTNFITPQTDLQVQIAEIWEEVLHIQSIGINQNFFELGGHSLLATQIVSRIRQNLKIDLNVRHFFASPTVEFLATWIESNYHLEPKLTISKIKYIPRENNIPLSFSQEGLWFLWQLDPNSSAYNISNSYHLKGELDITSLSKSWIKLVEHHEALRTTFKTLNGQPIQIIHQPEKIEFPIIDLQHLPIDERQIVVDKLQTEIINQPFDLTTYPLWQVKLIQLSPTQNLLFISIHHIIFDGWSWDLLFDQLTTFYRGFLGKETKKLVNSPIDYADFSHWQRQWLPGENFNTLVKYWQQQLAGIGPVLNLPTDKPRPAEIGFIGVTESIQLSRSLSSDIKLFSRQQGVTLFMTLLAAFEILLYRYSGQTDIVIGSPIAGRNNEEIERIIGYFVNTIVLRTDLTGNPSFTELLAKVKETTLGAYEHQDLPFDKLVQELNPERSVSYHPIYQVMFAWQNTKLQSLQLPGLEITEIPQDLKIAKFDLTLELAETDQGITGFFEYRTDLFESATIKRMIGHFQTLLAAIVANPHTPIANLPLLTPQEQKQLLIGWNNTTVSYPPYPCIHQLIEQQVQRTPEAIAVVWENQKLTYQELNNRANQIAHYLRSLGIQPDVRVGICVERCLEMIVGMLAILKAGAAYLPLDPAYPSERIEFILSDAQVPVILTKSTLLKSLPDHQAQVICLDTDESILSQQNIENPDCQNQPHNLAYIIYTSGSTGKPKGTMIEHRSLINAYLAWEDAYHLSSETCSHLQMASFSFDVCTGDLVRALCSGAKLVLCPKDFLLDPQQLYTIMQQEKIDCAEFVPAVLRNLVQYLQQTQQNLAFMKLLVAGSDSWYLSEYKYIRSLCGDQTRLINSYGVSEATIDTTYFETERVDFEFDRLTPIGRPFANNQVYLLDDHKQPVPIGVPGELYIGGAGLARGYFNRPDLTADKFIPHPFADYFPHNQDQRLYKTNDKARYLADGNIEFLGRLDNQVKIRGFRIELGEIESLINQHPQIKESIVIVREDIPGNKRIVAYMVAQPEQQINYQELSEYLSQQLPNYFLPSAYVILDYLSLTPNGKLDRKALPIPEYSLKTDNDFVSPRTQTEIVLANIWSQILGLERVSINDNFFALGGHSLLIVQVINQITRELSVEISLRQVFQTPVLAELAQIIDNTDQKNSQIPTIPQRPNPESAALSFAQQRLWFLEQLEPGRVDYHISSGCRFLGSLNIPVLQQALDAIVVHHEILRTNFITENGEPIQVIRPPRPVELSIFDLQKIPVSQQEEETKKLLQQEQERTFRLSEDLMLRGCLLQISSQEQILLLIMHHIASDGWSLDILTQQLSQVYTAFLNGQSNPLTPMAIQYADFALWQRQWLSGEEFDRQLQYWKQQLTGANTILELPTDYPRPPIQTYSGGGQSWVLGKNLTTALKNLCLQEKVTLYITLLAAFSILLSRHSGQDDILVGSPIAGRQKTEAEKMIGFFINTLVLRINLSENPTFQKLLNRTLQLALDAYSYQDFPFEKLVKELNLKRDSSRNPLFQVWFNMLNLEDLTLEFPGLVVEPIYLPDTASKFDITLYVQEKREEIHLKFVYNTDLFSTERITEMLQQFDALLTQIVAKPEKSIHSYSLVTANSQALLPNPSQVIPQPEYPSITQTFTDWATQTPHQSAIIQNERIWSYQELAQASTEIAQVLITANIQKGDVVAVSGVRSFGLIASMLGVLMSGGVLLNIDPNLPTTRQELMLSTAVVKAVLFISQEVKNSSADSFRTITINPETGKSSLNSSSTAPVAVTLSPDDSAYIFFTSGTTGTPKGVLGCHKGLSQFLHWQRETFAVTPQDRVAQLTGLSFDVVLRDIFLPLTSGATLCLPAVDDNLSPMRVLPWLERNQISLMHTVPTLIQSWLMDVPAGVSLQSLRLLFFAGEPLTDTLVKQWQNAFPESGQIINLYGPTETTLAKCYYPVPKNPVPGVQPVGSPLPQTQALVFTPNHQLCGIGESGEIVIRTPFRTKGYINADPEQLSKFAKNPFSEDDTDLLYYTGDRGRYRLDGTLEILGRIDHQVKIRGVRIEPGEIAGVLNQHPNIKASIVIAREDVPGDKRLVAYIVPNPEQTPTSSEIRQFLKQRLPDYMIPAAFVMLEALPLTPNGKIDRRALAVPEYSREDGERTFLAPRNRLEMQLTQIWEEVLGVKPIGITDNFFELGGHSLIAVRLFVEIEKLCGKNLPLATLFQAQTIEELAAVIGQDGWSAPWSSLVKIQPGDSKPPLFCVHPIGGNVLEYYQMAHYLGQDQPVYGLQALGLDGKQVPLTSIEDMAYQPIEDITQSTLIFFWLVSTFLICVGRFVLNISFDYLLRKKNVGCNPVFIICDSQDKEQVCSFIQKERRYIIAGSDDAKSLDRNNRQKTLEKLNKLGVTEVFVSLDAIRNRMFLCWLFQASGITVSLLPVEIKAIYRDVEIHNVGGMNCLSFTCPLIVGKDFWTKRAFDIFFATLFLIFTFPIYLAISIAIKLDSPGSVFYQQTRIGLHGKKFQVWKFRTMRTDADKMQKELEALNETKDGVLFKIKDDPRVTRIGKFLRRYSLDELPQLFNVVLGEMSLVGPRPLPTRDVEKFSESHFIRQEVLPGVTGMWQVSGRSDILDFDQVIKLDLRYIENWSLWLDFQILLKTVQVVLNKEGAY